MAAVASVPLGIALRFWLRLGFISFGGPAGQISIMHQELVEKRRWISESRFLHALNYCMLLPGPEAQQLATYIGWLMHGAWGGIIAGGLFVLPSLFILIALSWVYVAYGTVAWIAGILYGFKPAVVALVFFAAYRIGSRTLKNIWLLAIAGAAFAAVFALHAPFPLVVLGAALAGALGGRLAPKQFSVGPAHAPGANTAAPALIDTFTEPPAHARFTVARFVRSLITGLALWTVAFVLLAWVFGSDGTLSRMAWFFTKAALLTFGGAYAVLPYVYQGAVESYLWLSGAQMIDGLALGETTPGPLIMVVAFVGFLGAAREHVAGDMLFLSGAMGAAVATFFTFLPSFAFILVGGPLVEATRGDLKFTAPLTGITAAVVGVILSLAVFFAWNVFWPEASAAHLFAGRFDWISLLIGGAAALALWRYKVGVVPVVLGAGAAGLAHSLLLRVAF